MKEFCEGEVEPLDARLKVILTLLFTNRIYLMVSKSQLPHKTVILSFTITS